MSVAFDKPSWWQRIKPVFQGFDLPLMCIVVFMCALGLINMYSVGYDHGTRFVDQSRNMLLAAMVMFLVAQVPPQRLMAVAVPLYTVGLILLLATALFGITKKGATRWLNVGMIIQPSEILKIATPLMLAWWFQRREGQLRGLDFVAAGALLLLPTALVLKQPDLGTSLLVLSGGLYVIFFAGLSWRLIVPVLLAGAVGITLIVSYQTQLCQPGVKWVGMHGYQKSRVCTLLDPTTDPLGKGFHVIQGMIAIGSGGVMGKGFMQGTQTHLEFIPERTTDFAFAAYAEEHGLAGCITLMVGFLALIFRGLVIAAQAPTLFSRLLAGAISLSFFTYAFVNMGMVSGILPVVGVPLPFISYGGTAMVTMGFALGMLMSIANSRGLMQR
jgi:rod shape determining protein RodA